MTQIQLKKIIFRILFAFEIIIMGGFYFFGANGVYALQRLKQEKKGIERQVQDAKFEITNLENKIHDWKSSDFEREKIAREQLHMARPDELVIYLN
jgi:cell division protein FtsB